MLCLIELKISLLLSDRFLKVKDVFRTSLVFDRTTTTTTSRHHKEQHDVRIILTHSYWLTTNQWLILTRWDKNHKEKKEKSRHTWAEQKKLSRETLFFLFDFDNDELFACLFSIVRNIIEDQDSGTRRWWQLSCYASFLIYH